MLLLRHRGKNMADIRVLRLDFDKTCGELAAELHALASKFEACDLDAIARRAANEGQLDFNPVSLALLVNIAGHIGLGKGDE
jgi:hypothetical protein